MPIILTLHVFGLTVHIVGLLAVIRRKRPAYRRCTPEATAENILNREFTANAVNKKWCTDVTEMKYGARGEKAYLSAILDLKSRDIVSFAIGRHNNNQLVFETFNLAIQKYPDAHPLFHSDRGFQYTSKQFKDMLEKQGMRQSMSRVGRCIDNGPMEGFWTTSIFCTNPNPNCIMKAFFVYSVWCFWPFSLPVQFHTLSLVFITIFHRNTPNTGCPVLGVHIISEILEKLFVFSSVYLTGSGSSLLFVIVMMLLFGDRIAYTQYTKVRQVLQAESAFSDSRRNTGPYRQNMLSCS